MLRIGGEEERMRKQEETKMVEITKKEGSHWWWFDSHQTSLCSPWLQSTLGELDKKTKAMLKLIEEDADSFAQRAEMYYKKRPELISMVEDFYRTHRSLAERYDQLKSDSGNRLLTTLGLPFSTKYQSLKFMGRMDQSYDFHSEIYDLDESAESEVDDPEQEYETEPDEGFGEIDDPALPDETQLDEGNGKIKEPVSEIEGKEVEVLGAVCNDEVIKLREEIERLKEENMIQKIQLLEKDEEKREVIRQLSSAMEVLKLENVNLRKFVARDSPKKKSLMEFGKLKEVFSGKLFHGSSNSRASILAL